MHSFLSEVESQVLRLLDGHPHGLTKDQIIQRLQDHITWWDIEELLVKGFLEIREGKIRVLGHLPFR